MVDEHRTGSVVAIENDTVEVILRESLGYCDFLCVDLESHAGNAEDRFQWHHCGPILAEHKCPELARHVGTVRVLCTGRWAGLQVTEVRSCRNNPFGCRKKLHRRRNSQRFLHKPTQSTFTPIFVTSEWLMVREAISELGEMPRKRRGSDLIANFHHFRNAPM